MRILLADDEAYVLEGLRTMIDWRQLHIRDVDTAVNGEEAWELYVRNKPDLVMTDVTMPKMNGLELVKKIRADNRDVPIIILSGYDDFEYAREAISSNVSHYILKPALHTEIRNIVEEVVTDLELKRKQQSYQNDYLQQMERMLPALRENYILDLITARGVEKEITENQLHFFQLDRKLLAGGLVVSLMLFRHKVAKEQDWQLYKYAVLNIVREVIAGLEGVEAWVTRFIDDRLLVLVLDDVGERALEKAKRVAEDTIAKVTQYLGVDMNVGIGRWYGSASDYPASYQESNDMLNLLENECYQDILYIDHAKEIWQEWPRYPTEQIRMLTDALKSGDERDVLACWADLEHGLMQDGVSPGFVRTTCVALMSQIAFELSEANRLDIDPQQLLFVVRDIQKTKTKSETLRAVKERLVEYARDIAHEERREGYVQKLVKIIEARYREPISFEGLAREMNLSRNYLSYLFKKETGVSFIQYLASYRIEKAKQMLRANQYMVYEIAEMVGYPDPAYFSKVFKNMVGVSPLDYKIAREQG